MDNLPLELIVECVKYLKHIYKYSLYGVCHTMNIMDKFSPFQIIVKSPSSSIILCRSKTMVKLKDCRDTRKVKTLDCDRVSYNFLYAPHPHLKYLKNCIMRVDVMNVNIVNAIFPRLYALTTPSPQQGIFPTSLIKLRIEQVGHYNDFTYLVNLTTLFFDEYGSFNDCDYPISLRKLVIGKMCCKSIAIPENLVTLRIEKGDNFVMKNYPASLKFLKIPNFHHRTECQIEKLETWLFHDIAHFQSLKYFIGSHPFFPLSKNIEKLYLHNGEDFVFKYINTEYPALTSLIMSRVTMNEMNKFTLHDTLIHLKINHFYGQQITLPRSLKTLYITGILTVEIIVNDCHLTHIYAKCEIFNPDILKIDSLKVIIYHGIYHTTTVLSKNVEHLRIKSSDIIITKENYPKLKKLVINGENIDLKKMTFPKSLIYLHVHFSVIEGIPKWIKYIAYDKVLSGGIAQLMTLGDFDMYLN